MNSPHPAPGGVASDGTSRGRSIIACANLTKSYGSATAPVDALRGVALDVERGERIALLGKSGSGKSTLLNLLGGLDQPTSGTIVAGGSDLARLTTDELAWYRLTVVGMIFQAYNLIPSRSALQNVELPMVFAGRPPRERRASARKALEAVGLGHRLHHRPNELSGGEHQRVAIARAIVNDPQILLADEPTGNLDSATAHEVVEILMTYLSNHGATLVMVTHDEDLAHRCAHRIVRLKDGCIDS